MAGRPSGLPKWKLLHLAHLQRELSKDEGGQRSHEEYLHLQSKANVERPRCPPRGEKKSYEETAGELRMKTVFPVVPCNILGIRPLSNGKLQLCFVAFDLPINSGAIVTDGTAGPK